MTGAVVYSNIYIVIANYSRKTTHANSYVGAVLSHDSTIFYVEIVKRKESRKMSIPVFTKVRVVSKSTKEGTKKDGTPTTFFNLKVADPVTFDSQVIGVSEEVYNEAEEGKDIKLVGKAGGLKEKYWYFNAVQK